MSKTSAQAVGLFGKLGGVARTRVIISIGAVVAVALALFARPAIASANVDGETAFALNTFAFLIWGALVMWMCAGFTMLESGSVRTKNASMICLKNVGLYAIAGLAYFVIGYNLMYGEGMTLFGVDLGNFIGSFELFYSSTPDEAALLGGDEGAMAAVTGSGASSMSNWFFQMVFVATAASIMSGAMAERVKLWSFFLFTLLLTGAIYPIVGAWTWGGGWLAEMGFEDFAGSTIVHSVGGWAALAGIMVLGPRLGKFPRRGGIRPTPPSNIVAVTLGVFILWFGWFGFNGGSQLALASAADAVAMSVVLVNTTLAGAGGTIAALIVSRPVLGRMDLFAGLNGALAGLVAITAGPDILEHGWAIVIGGVGGVVCVLGMRLFEIVKLDDVVGAIPTHLFAGVWGTLAAGVTNGGDIVAQLVGIVVIGAFVFGLSWPLWRLMGMTLGVRVSADVERLGQDAGELGIEAYPEFVVVPDVEDEE